MNRADYDAQVSLVQQLGFELASPAAQLLTHEQWGVQFGRYQREVERLEAMTADPSNPRACWQCGGATFPEPHGRSRWCPFCSQVAESAPHPADVLEAA